MPSDHDDRTDGAFGLGNAKTTMEDESTHDRLALRQQATCVIRCPSLARKAFAAASMLESHRVINFADMRPE